MVSERKRYIKGNIIGNLLHPIGMFLAGYAGYAGFHWYFIFISSLIMALGYSIVRAPQVLNVFRNEGIFSGLKLVIMLAIFYAIITALIYFISSYFS